MKNKVLFGETHLLNHNNTWLVRGLFEIEGKFYKFTNDDLMCSSLNHPNLFWPRKGDVIAFTSLEGGPTWKYVELGDEEVSYIAEILGIWLNISPNHHSKRLVDAVKNSNVDKVRTLLEDGADPNSVDEKGNPALLLSIGKDKEIAKTLVIFGADPDRPNVNGVSPSSFASDNNYKGFLPILLLYRPPLTYDNWLKEMRNSTGQ